jgi:crotonobetainyl-CoA:carnitine CoA-transferase CaiB-like acyl-CoA transferase
MDQESSISDRTTSLPLSGLRIVDLSRVLAGPYCTALLAEMGADVIKIEMPGRGDDAREFLPFKGGESGLFMLVNKAKKSVTLNLKSPRGVEILHRLVRDADILMANFRPGTDAGLGADYETLRKINPALVHASISGFGQQGPLSARPAYDIIAQAMSGLMSMTGEADGPPTRVGESVGDLCAGLHACWSILAAIRHRDRTGEGQHLDIAMTDSLISMMVTPLSLHLFANANPGRTGNRHPISTPFDSYPCRDGYVVIAVASDALFTRLAGAMERPELVADQRFASDFNRTKHEPELRVLITAWTGEQTVEGAVRTLDGAGVPASPILSVAEAVASEHIVARGLVTTADHPSAGTIPLVRQPVRFSQCPPGPIAAPPTLGQHTDEVLGAFLDTNEIAALRRDGVI